MISIKLIEIICESSERLGSGNKIPTYYCTQKFQIYLTHYFMMQRDIEPQDQHISQQAMFD